MTPARGLVLVRPIVTQETFAGSLIIVPETARERLTAHQVEVVAVGAPSRCDDADCERQHQMWDGIQFHHYPLHAGDWVVITPRSVVATDEDNLWLIRQDHVLGVFQALTTKENL